MNYYHFFSSNKAKKKIRSIMRVTNDEDVVVGLYMQKKKENCILCLRFEARAQLTFSKVLLKNISN